MRTKLMQKWIDALRSGKYQQGQGCLSNGNKFCCLGVACDISGLGQWVHSSFGYRMYDTADYGGSSMALPSDVKDALGVFSDVELDLIDMNDKHGKSFDDIAQFLEDRFPKEYES